MVQTQGSGPLWPQEHLQAPVTRHLQAEIAKRALLGVRPLRAFLWKAIPATLGQRFAAAFLADGLYTGRPKTAEASPVGIRPDETAHSSRLGLVLIPHNLFQGMVG